MTFPAVAPQAPIDETLSVSRQAHAQSPIDGRQWESVKHGDESARCYAAFVPRYRGRNCTLSSNANQNRGASGIHEPPSGGPHIGGAPATPIAALSGPPHISPRLCRGILTFINLPPLQAKVQHLAYHTQACASAGRAHPIPRTHVAPVRY